MDNENNSMNAAGTPNYDNTTGAAQQSEPTSVPSNNTLMGVLSYLGPLVVIPFLVARDEAFVRFHVKQGLVLLIINILVWTAASMTWMLWPLWQIINLAVVILAIVGIINVVQGKEKELPLIGRYAQKINI